MARSPKKPEAPAPQPELAVSRQEAAERIQAQINEGEELLGAQPRSEAELEALRQRRRIWSDYNRELLAQIFTTPAIAEEYSAFGGGAFSMSPTFSQLVEYFRDDVQTSLTRLRSILRRLELFPAPAAEEHRRHQRREPIGNTVFLVHGHNNEAKEAVARFLEKLDLEVVILHEQPDKGRTIIEKFEDYANVGYAVVLVTGDDVGASRHASEDLHLRGRQNVILELGYFLGALGRTHVCALMEEGVEVPSDLSGVLYVPLDPAGAWKLRVASEIKASGIQVDMNRAI